MLPFSSVPGMARPGQSRPGDTGYGLAYSDRDVFTLGTPALRWETGEPFLSWAAGTPGFPWETEEPYLS